MQGDLTYKLRPQDYLRMDAAFVQKVQVWQLVAIKFGKMNDRYDETERTNSMSAFSLRVIFLTLLVASDNIYNFHACNLYRLSQPTRQRRRRRRKEKEKEEEKGEKSEKRRPADQRQEREERQEGERGRVRGMGARTPLCIANLFVKTCECCRKAILSFYV